MVLATACSSHGEARGRPTPSSAQPTPSASSSSPVPQVASPDAVVAESPAWFEGGFTTPSDNIQCQINGTFHFIGCSVRQHSWAAPSPPDGCVEGVSPAAGVWLTEERTELRGECSDSDPVRAPVLTYGTGVQVGTLRCLSLRRGLDCADLGTAKGFFVSRAEVRVTATSPEPRTRSLPREPDEWRAPAGFRGGFASPSRNILCHIEDDAASCYLRDSPWKRPDVPCEGEDAGDPTSDIQVTGARRGEVHADCWSDFPYADAEHPLPYGGSVRVGALSCTSRRTGMTCTNARTKHGFSVNQTSYRVF